MNATNVLSALRQHVSAQMSVLKRKEGRFSHLVLTLIALFIIDAFII